ncbi:MAG: efflux RND transporter periplasmic adaptor subunit [Desulfobacterales bacterium]
MKRGFIFKTVRVILVLAVAAGIAFFLYIHRPKAERRIKPKTDRLVEVFPARAEDVPMVIEAYGTVKPRQILKLVAEVSGRIVDIHSSFQEGEFCKKGTVLITIDSRSYRLEVERRKVQVMQADAELKHLSQEVLNLKASAKIAKSDVALAHAEFVRLKELSGKKAVARTNLDQAEQRYLQSLDRLQKINNQMALTAPLREQLNAQRKMATVLLRQANLNLEKTRVLTTFDGWILEKAVEKGQLVKAGQYLGQVYKEGKFDIDVRIPVKDLKWLQPFQTQSARPEARIVFGREENIREWKGHVSRIKAKMDEKTRTLPVVVEIDTSPTRAEEHDIFRIRPGMFIKVQIKGIKIHRVFVLPRYVVHAGDVIYTVSKNRLQIRPVKVLRRFKELVYIQSGLTDGEQIIKTPLPGAVNDLPVRVEGAAATNTPS